MTAVMTTPDATTIRQWADAICAGDMELTSAQARSLLTVPAGSAAFEALMAAAVQVRETFCGNRVSFCSILNAKAGGCSENCSYCAQASGSTNMDYDKYRWMEDDDIRTAAESAADNGAGALGLVAAWKGVKEGRQLDMVCDSVRKLSDNGRVRADVNLGILENQHCADRLYEAGARVYGHNLETAASFFDQTCSSHSFEERLQTIKYIKQSGMGLCSGGIIGMGENQDQRVEFMEQLRFIEPNMIPINFLNPLEGTGLEDKPLVDPDEGLVTLATMRLFLPDRNIMVAGGKEVTFGERQDEVLSAGVNAIMIGNYLTTLGTTPEYWLQAAADHGLQPKHESLDDAASCGSSCGCS